MGFTGGKNDIGAGTYTDFIGACTPALTLDILELTLYCIQLPAFQYTEGSVNRTTP